jgi:hypothetical protein
MLEGRVKWGHRLCVVQPTAEASDALLNACMQRDRVPIRCIGGPFDGRTSMMRNPRPKLKLTVEQDDGTKVTHIYGRKNTRSGVECHFSKTVLAATV